MYPPFIFVPFTAAAAARAAAAHFPHSSPSSPAVLEGNTEGALGHITGFAVPERTAAAAAVTGFQVVLPVPWNTIRRPITTLLQRLCLVKIFRLGGLNFMPTFFGISIGIKRRLIDIAKKITFYFCKMFENVQFFSHLHLKYAKSAIMTQKFLSWKISIWVSKNAEFYADFKFVDAGFQKCPKQKLKAKNHEKMHKNENTQNSHGFLDLAFFRGICLSRHKILRFLKPLLTFFKKIFFWVIIAFFA